MFSSWYNNWVITDFNKNIFAATHTIFLRTVNEVTTRDEIKTEIIYTQFGRGGGVIYGSKVSQSLLADTQ